MKHYLLQQKYLIDEKKWMDETGFRIGEVHTFQIIKKLGEGSSCWTYLARNMAGNQVVIKEFYPLELRSYMKRNEDDALILEFPDGYFGEYLKKEYGEKKQLFYQEWLMQMQLQNDNRFSGTNNPLLYEGGPDRIPYIVMNCDGDPITLADMSAFQEACEKNGLDYVTMILRVLRTYAVEIDRLHKEGILLFDIKPGNMLVTLRNQELSFRRVIDYGSARKWTEIDEKSGFALSCTEEFAAPEVIDRDYEEIGTASDVYAFGRTVIQFLTGQATMEDKIYLLHLSDEKFRRNVCRMAQEHGFTAILSKPASFFRLLNIFVSCTMSNEIGTEADADGVKNIGNMSAKTYQRRLSNMEDVIRILSLLIGDDEFRYGERKLHKVLQRAKELAKTFEENAYGAETEKCFNESLFSPALLPKFYMRNCQETTQIRTFGEKFADIFGIAESGMHGYIEAESGSGKTAAFKYAFSQWLLRRESVTFLPVWIPMGRVCLNSEHEKDQILRVSICRQLFGEPEDMEQKTAHLDQLQSWMEAEDLPFQIVLFLDGMNEAIWQKRYEDIKKEIILLMEMANVTVIVSGQNQNREFEGFDGLVWNILPIGEDAVREYLNEKIPVWSKEEDTKERIQNIIPTLKTPCLLHYFCIPFLGLAKIPMSAIPKDEARIMEQYLFGMEYCVQNKIHASVAEYPEQTRPRFGAFLLEQVAAAVCWQMAYHGEMFATPELLKHTVERLMVEPAGNMSLIEGIPVREQVYREKIKSLSWCTYLFEYHDFRYHIIHESYRDFLAARFLLKKIEHSENVPEDFWSRIPDGVMKYLSQLADHDVVVRLRKKFLKKNGVLRRFYESQSGTGEMISAFYEKDYEMAGHNLRTLIQMCPQITKREKTVLLWGIPQEWIRDPNKKEAEVMENAHRWKEAELFLRELESCNAKGQVCDGLKKTLKEEQIKAISQVAGKTFFFGDDDFRPKYLLQEMLKRKGKLMDGGTEVFFADTSELRERDLMAMRRQEGTLTLLKQFVLLEQEQYQKYGTRVSAEHMLAFAQLFFMLNYAVFQDNIHDMEVLHLEKRITGADLSLCKERKELQHACLLLGCFGDCSVKEFCVILMDRILHDRVFWFDRMKRKHRIAAFLLLVCMGIVCVKKPDLLFILAGCAGLGFILNVLVKDGALILDYIWKKQ